MRDERGATAVVIALSMVVLVGFTSVALDGGLLYHQKRALQNIADAAALAGAHELPASPPQALVQARQYVLANGGLDSDIRDISVRSVFNTNDALRVQLGRTTNLMLAPVLGYSQQNVAAGSVGLVTPIEPYDIWPWGVTQDSLLIGVDQNLKVGARNSAIGNFMALDFPNSSGASDYQAYIQNGFSGSLPGPIPPNTWTLNTQTGNIAGPTQSGVDYLLDQPPCNPPWEDIRCPRVGLIPVLSAHTWSEVAGKSEVRIVGFATFYLNGLTGGIGNQQVQGRFINSAFGVGRKSWVGLPLTGLLGVRLWQ